MHGADGSRDRPQRPHGDQREGVEGGRDPQRRRRTQRADHRAAEGRPNDLRHIDRHRVKGVRIGEVAASDQVEDQRGPRRLGGRLREADREPAGQQHPVRRVAQREQDRDGRDRDQRPDAGPDQQAHAVESVGEDAAERPEQQRHEANRGEERHQELRPGRLPDDPAEHQRLRPRGAIEEHVGEPEQPELRVLLQRRQRALHPARRRFSGFRPGLRPIIHVASLDPRAGPVRPIRHPARSAS